MTACIALSYIMVKFYTCSQVVLGGDGDSLVGWSGADFL